MALPSIMAMEHCLVTLFAAVPQALVSYWHTRQALADRVSECCEVLGLSRYTAQSVNVCHAQQRCLFAGCGDSQAQAVQGGIAPASEQEGSPGPGPPRRKRPRENLDQVLCSIQTTAPCIPLTSAAGHSHQLI